MTAKIKAGSWVQDPETGKLVPKDEYYKAKYGQQDAPYIQGDIESFKSPIDGSMITDRSHLREHNTKHGVTDSRDYSTEYYQRRAKEREGLLSGSSDRAVQERKTHLSEILNQHGI